MEAQHPKKCNTVTKHKQNKKNAMALKSSEFIKKIRKINKTKINDNHIIFPYSHVFPLICECLLLVDTDLEINGILIKIISCLK